MSTPPERTTALTRYEQSVVAPPAPAEWTALVEMAKTVASTEFVPTSYRGNANAILACFLTARGLGLDLMQGLRQIVMVNQRPTFQAELMVALVRRAGHSILLVEEGTDETQATVLGTRGDTGEQMKASFTLTDAARANLLNNDRKPSWQMYPDAMLWARAVSKLCRRLFPDVLLGITHTPEELGANVDSAGNLIDDRDRVEVVVTGDDGEPVEAEIVNPPERDERTPAERAQDDAGVAAAEGEGPSGITTLMDEAQAAAARVREQMAAAGEAHEPEPEPEPEPADPSDPVEQALAEILGDPDKRLIEKHNMGLLRKVATRVGVSARDLNKDDLVQEIYVAAELMRKRAAEASQPQGEPEPAASDFLPAGVQTELDGGGPDTLATLVDAAIDYMAANFPDDPGWSRAEVVAQANKLWDVNVATVAELDEEYLDKIWSAVPEQVKEAVGG